MSRDENRKEGEADQEEEEGNKCNKQLKWHYLVDGEHIKNYEE